MTKKRTPRTSPPPWVPQRTAETRKIEARLLEAGFAEVDVYRFNCVSIRIRVIDPRFEGKSGADREDMIFR